MLKIGPMTEDDHSPRVDSGLKRFRLFSGLDEKDLKDLENVARVEFVKKRQPVYLPGDAAGAVYLLERGRVKIFRVTEDGREFTIAILEPGEMFGEMEVLGGGPRDTIAESLEDIRLRVIPREDFERILRSHPALMFELTKLIGLQLKKTQGRIEDLAFRDVPTRLARLLLGFSKEFGRPAGDGLKLNFRITHQDLASLIGSTRETVSAVLGDFKRQGLIQLDRRFITIRNHEGFALFR